VHALAQSSGFVTDKIHLCATLEIGGHQFAADTMFQTRNTKKAARALTLACAPYVILDQVPLYIPAGPKKAGWPQH
jgi:hypothetical protein